MPTITAPTVGGVVATANHATPIGIGHTATAGSGIFHMCWRVVTTSSIAVGGALATLTSNQSAVKRAAHAQGFSGATSTLRGTVTTGTSTSGAPTASSGSGVAGDLVIGSVSGENNSQATGDSDTLNGTWTAIVGIATSGGQPATNVVSGSQAKITTASGIQSFGPVTAADSVACVYSVQPVPDPAITQAAYRWFGEGTEAGATALAAQDTAVTGDITNGDATGTLRIRLQETTAAAVPATDDWQLQYEKNLSGSWIAVTASSVAAQTYDSPNLTNQAVTTNRLTGGTGTFVAGQVSEDSLVDDLGWAGNNYTELVYALKIKAADVVSGDTLRFRVLRNGATATMTYSQTPTINITQTLPAVTQAAYRFYASGTESGSAALAAQDTTPSVDVTSNVDAQLRIRLQSTTIASLPVTDDWRLQYEKNASGTWTNVIAVTNDVQAWSSGLTDNAATTNRLGAGTGTFDVGKVSTGGVVTDLGWSGNDYTEVLYGLKLISGTMANGDTLRFRVLRNAATTGMTFTQVPTINVTKTVLTAVQVDRPTTWDIKAAPTVTRSTSWDTTYVVTKVLSSTTWNIRQAITKPLSSTTWSIRQAVTKALGQTTWKTRQAVTLPRVTTWDVTLPATQVRVTTWRAQQAIAKTLGATTWKTRQAVAKTLGATTWKIRQAVARTRDTSWNVDALAVPVAGEWIDIPLPAALPVVDGTTYVVSVTTDGYEYGYRSPEPTSQTPNLTGPQGYYAPGSDVFPSIDAGTNHYLIDVVYHAGDPRGTTTWLVDQAVIITRAASWNVAGTRTQVTKTTGATTWNIKQAVAPTRVTTWDTLARITPTRVTTWDVTTPITKALSSTTWRIKQAVATAKSTTWDSTARTTKALSSTTWNIKAAVGPTRSTTWRAAQAVGPTRVVTWDVLTPVAALTRSTTWDNRTAVTITRGGGDAWSPDDIAGLASWIDGATYAGTVTNKGGGPAFTVGGSPPMAVGTYLNGMPTIRFKTNEGRLRSAWPTNPQNYTLLYLVRWVGPGVGRGFSAQYPPSNLLVGFHTSGKDSMYDNGTWLTGPEGLSWAPWGTGPGPWRMYEADGVDLVDSRFFIDGTLVSGVGPGAGGGLTNGWGISGYEASSSETLDIEVAELLLYDHRLSDVERVQAEDYLTEKWLGAGPAGGGWRVLAPVSLVRSTTWDTARALAAVSVTRSTTWRIKAPILSVRSTTWDTTSTATTIKPTSWDVTSPRTTTRSTTWDAMSPVAAVVRSTTWDATTTTTRALGQTTWKIRVPIANTRSTTWRAEAAVAITRGTTWRAAAATVVPRSTTWDSRFALAITRPTTWDALVVVTPLTRPTTWDVTGTTALVRLTTWDVLSPRAITRGSSTWNIRALVTNTRGTTWAVEGFRATITRVRPTTWNVTGQPVLTRTTTWDSQRAVAVVSRSTTWRAPSPVTATRLTTWQIRPRITATRSTTWDYLIGVPALTRSTTWRAAAPVTITRPTTWDARVRGRAHPRHHLEDPGSDRPHAHDNLGRFSGPRADQVDDLGLGGSGRDGDPLDHLGLGRHGRRRHSVDDLGHRGPCPGRDPEHHLGRHRRGRDGPLHHLAGTCPGHAGPEHHLEPPGSTGGRPVDDLACVGCRRLHPFHHLGRHRCPHADPPHHLGLAAGHHRVGAVHHLARRSDDDAHPRGRLGRSRTGQSHPLDHVEHQERADPGSGDVVERRRVSCSRSLSTGPPRGRSGPLRPCSAPRPGTPGPRLP